MALHDYHLPDARARGHAGRSVPLHFWGVLGHLGQHLLDQGLRGGDLYLRLGVTREAIHHQVGGARAALSLRRGPARWTQRCHG